MTKKEAEEIKSEIKAIKTHIHPETETDTGDMSYYEMREAVLRIIDRHIQRRMKNEPTK